MVKKILMYAAFAFFAVYLIFWFWHFMIAGNNVSFVFATLAQMGGAEQIEEHGEILYNTENANGLGESMSIIARGGGLVDFLAFLFILTNFFIVERWFAFFAARGKFSENKLMTQVKEKLRAKEYDEAMGICKKQDGVLGRVLLNGIARYKNVQNETSTSLIKDSLSEAVDEQTAMEVTLLERNLIAIATIASIGTMAGLFGTVVGMIRAFSALSAKGRPDPNKLATGISEALINTAGGLAVAIVSIIAYNYFLAKMDKTSFIIEENSSDMIKILTGTELDV